MRVFVALDVPESVRTALAGFVAKLRQSAATARWTRLEGLHVTLKFIGEVAPDKVQAIEASLARIPSRLPIEIKFRNAGFFPNQRRPLVFWAGIEAIAQLSELAADVESFLEPLGIPRGKKVFSPHLTLARFKPQRGTPAQDELHAAIAAAAPLEFGNTVAREFHLFQSILKPGGAEYTRLATFPLAGGVSK